MSEVVIFETDVGVGVLVPVLSCGLSAKEIIAKDIPSGRKYRVVNDSDLPEDDVFRSAWTIDLTIDMDKAREIWMKNIRDARDEKLYDLDLAWMRAMEMGEVEMAKSIALKKQKLRDLPTAINLNKFKKPDDLKGYWPDILGG
jgi:hypothetical protein